MNKTVKLKRLLATPITDGPHETPDFVEQGVPFMSAESVKNGYLDFDLRRGNISKELHIQYCKKAKPQRDDVFMVKSGATTGKVAIVETDDEFSIWSPLALIRANKSLLHPRYLYYSLKSDYFQEQVENSWSFGTQQNIGMQVIENLPIPEIDIEIQEKFVVYLDGKNRALEKMITAKNHTHTHLSELRQAIIDTCILEVGMSNLLALKRVATMVNRGVSPDYTDDGKAKFINQACIYREGIKLSAAKSAKELSHMAGSRGYLYEGDLLVNSTGTGTLGRVAIFDQDNDGTYFADSHVTIVRPDRKKIDPQYLRYVMISTKFQDEVYTMCVSGSTNQIELSRERFRELQIPVPSLEKQREIVRQLEERIRNVDAADVTLRKSISQLEEYRSSLISNVVGGKVEVC